MEALQAGECITMALHILESVKWEPQEMKRHKNKKLVWQQLRYKAAGLEFYYKEDMVITNDFG